MADLHKMDRTWVCSVVFMDIAKYSSQSVDLEMKWKERFNGYLAEAIQNVPQSERVILDTGDGAAICFLGAPEAAMFAALQLCRSFVLDEQEQQPGLRVRLGINLGPVKLIKDINGNLNAIGDGINAGQRIMSFASENKILVSQSFFEVVSRLSDDYKCLFRLKGVEKDKHVREHTVYHLVPPGSEEQQDSAAGAVTTERVSAISAVDPLPSIHPLTLDVTTAKHKSWRGTVIVALAIALCIFVSVLYWTNHKTVSAINSIAVLPINDSGSDPNLEYMSDGITETLINSLSRIRTLRVMSQSAVFRFKANKISPLEQGKALKVDAILTGTMRDVSGQIELSVSLVEVGSGRQLWGELYRRPSSDLLRLQQSVSEAIAAQLRIELDAQEKRRFTRDYTASVDAYRLYLKGRYEWNKRSIDGYQKA